MTPAKSLLTPQEVCTYLSVCRRTLQRLLNRREIPFIRIGASLRFRPEAVESFLARRETKSRAA